MSRQARTLGAVLVLCALCVALGYAFGRRQSVAETRRAGVFLEQLSARLDLSTSQVAAVDRLLSEHDADMQELTDEHREQMRGPVEARLEETETALVALLEEDQRILYEELQNPDQR